jgi:hypothetical protein
LRCQVSPFAFQATEGRHPRRYFISRRNVVSHEVSEPDIY